jgi:hypothetical protein
MPESTLDVKEFEFLSREDQQEVLRDVREIHDNPSRSLYVGERLDRLQRKLMPYGHFMQIFPHLGIAVRTLYGYLYGYQNAAKLLPPGAVQAMMDANLLVNARSGWKGPLGVWTEPIEKHPAPKHGTAKQYREWVEQIQERRVVQPRGAVANATPKDPDELLQEGYLAIRRLYRRLPPNRTVRTAFLKKLVGIAMTTFEVEEFDFEPLPIPEDFRSARDRSHVVE